MITKRRKIHQTKNSRSNVSISSVLRNTEIFENTEYRCICLEYTKKMKLTNSVQFASTKYVNFFEYFITIRSETFCLWSYRFFKFFDSTISQAVRNFQSEDTILLFLRTPRKQLYNQCRCNISDSCTDSCLRGC